MRIGIIGALDVEVQALKELMDEPVIEKISSVDFYIGKIHGVDTVVATAGMGKVNAAVCAQTMILTYHTTHVINIGIAGGLTNELGIFDIAVAVNVVEHDMDASDIGDEPGFITGIDKIYMECDDMLIDIMYKAALSIGGIKVLKGTIASGDQFISTNEQRERIVSSFGAIAAEMEGASIGHVCTMNSVPFGVLRTISDSADSDSGVDYPTFKKAAAEHSIRIVCEMLKSLSK